MKTQLFATLLVLAALALPMNGSPAWGQDAKTTDPKPAPIKEKLPPLIELERPVDVHQKDPAPPEPKPILESRDIFTEKPFGRDPFTSKGAIPDDKSDPYADLFKAQALALTAPGTASPFALDKEPYRRIVSGDEARDIADKKRTRKESARYQDDQGNWIIIWRDVRGVNTSLSDTKTGRVEVIVVDLGPEYTEAMPPSAPPATGKGTAPPMGSRAQPSAPSGRPGRTYSVAFRVASTDAWRVVSTFQNSQDAEQSAAFLRFQGYEVVVR